MIDDKWRRRFHELALHVAQWSKDPSTKVGAVVVDWDRRVIGMGYNGFPRGVDDTEERYATKSVKYKLVVHAEANAILNSTSSVRDKMIVTTRYPCSDCAKLIVQSGLLYLATPAPVTDGHWAEDAHFSKTILTEGGLEVHLL